MITIDDIRQAQERIAPYAVRTPLLRLENLDSYLGCKVYVKAECMQRTGAFKLRGAMNKMLTLTPEQLKNGVVAASSGNHGRAVSYAAKMLNTKATIILPDTITPMKKNNILALGADIFICKSEERFAAADRICAETNGTMIPPFNDDYIMAGQGTAGLELAEDLPDVDTVIVPVSGGGLIGGVATAVKAMVPTAKVYGAEPALLPRYTVSLEKGEPCTVPAQKTVADALIGVTPGAKCFPVIQERVDGFADVEEDVIPKAMKLLLTEGKILAEPSSCIGIAAVMSGLIPVSPEDKVCFVISGGNVSLEQVSTLNSVEL